MKSQGNLGRWGAGLAGMLVLGACGGGDGGSNASTNIDQSQAAVVGEVASTQVSSMTSSMVNFSSSSGSLGGGFFAPASATGRMLEGVMRAIPSPEHRLAFARLRLDPNCTPTVDDETDSDLDGVPDAAVYTFDCAYTDPNPQLGSFTVTGTIQLFDTQDAANGFGFDVNLVNFTFALVTPSQNGDIETEVIVDGLFNLDILSSLADASQDVAFIFRVNNQRVFLSSWDWAINFIPSTTIDFAAEDMPPGDFDISGDFLFAGDAGQDGGDWAFSLNSTAPLVYGGTCTLEPPFDSGVIEGAIVGHTSVGFRVTYTGCGQLETIAAFDNS